MVTYLLTFIPQSRDAIASKNNLIFRILERFRGQLNKGRVQKKKKKLWKIPYRGLAPPPGYGKKIFIFFSETRPFFENFL